MKKQITKIALGILMLTSVMAMYGGETITFETNLTNLAYTVVGNSSNIDGLNISLKNGNISVTPALNYAPDNFTLIFFDNQTLEVEEVIYNVNVGGWGAPIRKNVTAYVPEHINTTEIVEVEETTVEIRYGLWHVVLVIVLGIFLGWFIRMIMKASSINNASLEVEDE